MKKIDPNILNLVLGFLAAFLVGMFTTPLVDRYVTLTAIAIFAIAFATLLTNAQTKMVNEISNRLPPVTYLNSRHEFDAASVQLIHSANRFLVATGGRSRSSGYLSGIESKIKQGGFRYFRILNSPEITNELQEHFKRVVNIDGVFLLKTQVTSIGNISICDTGVIIALPVPGHGDLRGIMIPSPTYATRLFEDYMAGIIAKSDAVSLDSLTTSK